MIKLQILPFVYQWSPADSYRLVLMNISNLSLVFVPMLHANRGWKPSVDATQYGVRSLKFTGSILGSKILGNSWS